MCDYKVGFGKARLDLPFSLNIGSSGENAMINVLTDSLPPMLYPPLFEFAAYYSSSGIVELYTPGESMKILYQAVHLMDFEKAHKQLCEVESGWRLEDNNRLLIPPKGSSLSWKKYREILNAATYEAQATPAQELLESA